MAITASLRTIGPNRVDLAIPCASSKQRWKVSPRGPLPARILAATARRPAIRAVFQKLTVGGEGCALYVALIDVILFIPERNEVVAACKETGDQLRTDMAYMSHSSLDSASDTRPLVTTSGKGFLGVGSGLVCFLTRR